MSSRSSNPTDRRISIPDMSRLSTSLCCRHRSRWTYSRQIQAMEPFQIQVHQAIDFREAGQDDANSGRRTRGSNRGMTMRRWFSETLVSLTFSKYGKRNVDMKASWLWLGVTLITSFIWCPLRERWVSERLECCFLSNTLIRAGDQCFELQQKSSLLSDEFGHNAETQRILVCNGEILLNALNYFISTLQTLCTKTIEDTVNSIHAYETAR